MNIKILENTITELIELGIVVISGQNPDNLCPIFKLSKDHLTKVINGDKKQIDLLKNKLHKEVTPELINSYKKMLDNPDYCKCLLS